MTPERTRILVVSGESLARQKIVRALARAGHEVMQASSCVVAWEAITQLHPHLVLLDEKLPDDVGMDVCRRVKADPGLRTIHVVMIAGPRAVMNRVGSGLPVGADSYLVRPFSTAALLAHVESMASVQRHAVALETGHQDLVDARRVALSMMQDADAERRRAEDAHGQLERSTQSLRLLSWAIETSPVVVVIADREGRIEYVNPQATMVTGYTAEELVGQHTRIFKSGRHPPEFYADLWAMLTAGRQWHGEFCNRKKSGELFWELASIAPVRGPSGNVAHYVAVKEDITERRHVMEALDEARRNADAANQAKSDFLANMSHELRTPLTAIIGFSEVLQDRTFGPLNEKQSKYVGNVLTASQHLLALINDILDMAKVEAGRMEIELSTIRLRALIESSVMLIRERALRHSQTVRTEIPDDLVVSADARKLKQVLFNLLSNSVKFTPDGGQIEVTAARVGEAVQVSVRDTGWGIGSEDQPRLFRDFEQLQAGYAREHEGTGLGLALCRKLVELHGGRIWVESEGRGAGSAFHFTIPLEAAARTAVLDEKGVP
jgi:PAS domain S-box-containing protein